MTQHVSQKENRTEQNRTSLLLEYFSILCFFFSILMYGLLALQILINKNKQNWADIDYGLDERVSPQKAV